MVDNTLEEIMIYCTQCGKKNDNDATFCNYCGAQLEKINTHQKSRKLTSMALCVTLLLLIIFAIITTIFHIKGSGIQFDWSSETPNGQSINIVESDKQHDTKDTKK
ncbi:MAG: hypothetical protein OMM_10189 [Candidatus Magnetoglobus multicellularis str. Araruama]|uniref:Zinc-ribbon domain-containing protein n=1 Tax=Candidatus Magnetoglobus multicellularis str. Araruama TaxID=890399 RepID=A0A1V1P1L6_9BACT|nr:MAG: hypothetical protein OMM_10189 [Candidatus Magnetoglobus multicellularis str. Araruama]